MSDVAASFATLVDLLRHRADAHPGELFFRFLQTGDAAGPSIEVSYDGLDLEARRIGAYLQSVGASGERVLLVHPPGEQFVAAFFGCLLAGAVAVPAYPPDPTRLARTLPRLRAIAEDACARFVLAPEAICTMASALGAAEPVLAALQWIASDVVPAGTEDQWDRPSVGPESLAFLQYTSGSTGSPKGVCVTHRNLLHNSELIRRGFDHPPGMKGVIWLPAYHDMGLIGGIIQPLYVRGSVTLISPLDFLRRPIRWLDAIHRFGAQTSGGPDFAYRLCVRKATDRDVERLDLSSWKVAFTGAEPVRADTLAAFVERFAPCGFDSRAIYPTYGLAESTLLVSGRLGGAGPRMALDLEPEALAQGRVATDDGPRARTLVGCGPVLDGMEVAIVDPRTRRRRAADEIGEIWLQGESVADGYWRRPDETREVFEARMTDGGGGTYLRTGDLGFLHDGELFIAGRHKDLLILRGRNVHPHDLERAVEAAHPRIRPGCSAAFSVDVDGEERAVVVAEIDERGGTLDTGAIVEVTREAVGRDHEVELHAVSLVRRGTIPKTSSGKIQRHACREGWLSGALDEWLAFVAPAAPSVAPRPADGMPRDVPGTIAALQRLLGAALGLEPEAVDPDRPFHSFGLDSLELVELTADIEDAFEHPMETLALFGHPSVEALARYLVHGESGAASPLEGEAAIPDSVGPYVGLRAACERIERRNTRYRFDVDADVPWHEIDAPGVYVSDAHFADLGVDVAAVRAHDEAWSLLQWAMALQICATFELLEIGIVFFASRESAQLGPTRSVKLLSDEEEKHIQLFRRVARHLVAQRPQMAERLEALAQDTYAAIRRGLDDTRQGDARTFHYLSWLRILFFEEYTVHFHQGLAETDGVQPAWLAAHAMHRREEVQHIVTDVRYLEALDLSEGERYRLSAVFVRDMIEDFDRQFAVEGARRLVESVYPEVRVMRDDPHRGARCVAGLVERRVFSHSWRAAPFFRELPAIRPEVMLDAARATGSVGSVETTLNPERRDEVAEPIAIVGMGCRFPGDANGPDALWANLTAGRDAITEVPIERWHVDAFFDPDPTVPGKMYTRWGGFLSGIEDFDHVFFATAPREARNMDPQQRLLLEVSWEALEHAGIAPRVLEGTQTAVYVGLCSTDYSRRTVIEPINAYSGTGNAFSVAAGRISYLLGLQGPCVAVDTACSSSLVAVDLACRSLASGDADVALAGGVNAILVPQSTIYFSELRAMSPVGRCKTFDASADGYVRSEGCGVVVLKRLADAQRDGDRILAVVRGSATNQDGRSNGLTAPNGRAQEAVMRAALRRAGLPASRLGYVEAHGTGTPLGDPIEVQAIGAVQVADRRKTPLPIGSVKTHIGHAEGAAGIAGLIKAVLVLEHGEIPGNLHFNRPNPHIRWADLPVEVVTQRRKFVSDAPRVVGVNSFGFGGTNAHVVLQEAPPPSPKSRAVERPLHIAAVSGHTEAALAAQAERISLALANVDASVADVTHTLTVGRSHFAFRAAFAVDSIEGMRERLGCLARGERGGRVAYSRPEGVAAETHVAFLFTGQGAQYPGIGRSLYETQPDFRAVIDECATHFDPLLDRPLRELLFDPKAPVDQTAYTQPVLFSVEVALAALWRAWGVEPEILIGHSIGEIAAACVAGVFSLADAARLVAARGRLMQALPRDGAMFSVEADESVVRAAIEPYGAALSIAAVNAPRQVVISGDTDAADRAAGELEAAGRRVQRLTVSHAFHSEKMRPMLAEFEAVAETVTYETPSIPVVSNLTAEIAPAEMQTPAYWTRHVMGCVRFADGLAKVLDAGVDVLVEVGPQPVLLGLAAKSGARDLVRVPSVRRGRDDWATLAASTARLYAHGVEIDWRGFDAPYARQRITLPTYAFQRQRAWLDEAPQAMSGGQPAAHPLLGVRLDVAGREAFEAVLSIEGLSWLADHRVGDRVVVPATAWIEMARAGAQALFGQHPHAICDLSIERALVLEDAESRRVQLVAERVADGEARVEIFSRGAARGAEWTRHARARARGVESCAPRALDLRAAIEICPDALDVRASYDTFEALGLGYGPSFRGLVSVRRGPDRVLAELGLRDLLRDEAGYALHPALLDAALQAAGALFEARGDGDLYLPVGLDRFECTAAGSDRLWADVRGRADEAGPTTAVDIDLYGPSGPSGEPIRAVARLEGLRFERVDAAIFRRAESAEPADAAFVVRWVPAPRPDGHGALDGRWLVVGDGALADALATEIGAVGEVVRGEAGDAVLRGAVLVFEPALVVEPALVFETGPVEALSATMETALALTHDLARRGDVQLTIVTRGAQAVEPGAVDADAAPIGGALWGFGRTVAQELPSLRCRLVDADPAAEVEAAAAAVLGELRRLDDEPQIAHRGGARHAARLDRAAEVRLPLPDAPSWRLTQPRQGLLDALTLTGTERSAPGAGEVEIAVEASGLNFRDVLNVLGMYPGPAGPLGGECAGRITAIGLGVTELSVGDPVIALAPSAFARYVVTDARLAVRRPRGMAATRAATIPITFLTAWYALYELAGLREGERVLVHAAAGGVGMAAVQLAQRIGADVVGTASPGKWAALRQLGVRRIMSSRTLAFADEIAADGRGVDVVLNALTGDFLRRSLESLAPGGRFIEMGKAEIWTDEQVAAVHPTARYRAFDLLDVDPAELQRMLRAIVAAFDAGELQPLPSRTFGLREAVPAFRYMAQARHIGKVVLTADETAAAIDADGTYLVTGGMGAIGQRIAEWLVDRGARHLVLAGRRAPDADQQAFVDGLRARGAEIRAVRADVADEASVRGLIAVADETLPDGTTPVLRGVVHAAGVLDDAALLQQTPERFERVLGAKARGAWWLHRATAGRPLDFFVLFSSVSGALGSAGQANYAAANGFLDGLAQARSAASDPAQSIGWGPWAGVGMAARLGARERQRLAAQGLEPMSPTTGVAWFERALRRDDAHLVVAPIALDRLRARLGGGPVPPMLSRLIDAAPPSEAPGFDEVLRPVAPRDRLDRLTAMLAEHAARVLGAGSAAEVDPRMPLRDLGLDSLMAIDLHNAMAEAVGRTLPDTLLFDYPTLEKLAIHLLEEVLEFEVPAVEALVESAPEPPPTLDAAEPIAVIGMACRFPGAPDVDALWDLLRTGRHAVREVPADRWDSQLYFDSDAAQAGRTASRSGGFLDDVHSFDAAFFGISPSEAEAMDPQQRLLLEVASEALEQAGSADVEGSNTGAFIGISTHDYAQRTLRDEAPELIGAYTGTGNAFATAAGRLAYTFGLRGPTLALDTACSSALVAVHLAGQSLRSGECDMAIAGGVNVMLSPAMTVYFSRLGVLSAQGRCRAFDADADGYVRAEGCGVVVLKRLSDATRDGDPVLGLIHGSAVNQNGRGNGLTAPNRQAQAAVIRQAWRAAGAAPTDCGYVEAFGAGTPMGDSIELGALADVFGDASRNPIAVGSVKTNIGHAEAAAGVASLIKVLSSLQHGEIPPSLHFETPNSAIAGPDAAVRVVTACEAWPASRLAGISGFGFGGTNAHLVVGPLPEASAAEGSASDPRLLVLSARSEAALVERATRLADHLEAHPELDFDAVCRSAAAGARHFEHRMAVVARDEADLRSRLRREGEGSGGTPPAPRGRLRIAFVVDETVTSIDPALARTHAAAEVLARADARLGPHLGVSLVAWEGRPVSPPAARAASFALAAAAAAGWRAWGIEPDAGLGDAHRIVDDPAALEAVIDGLLDGELPLRTGSKADLEVFDAVVPLGGGDALRRLGELFVRGLTPRWKAVFGPGRRVTLPPHPYTRVHYRAEAAVPVRPGAQMSGRDARRARLTGAAPARRREAIGEYVRHALGALLQRPSAALTDDADLSDLGLDSLAAVEAIQTFQRELGVQIYPDELFGLHTVGRLADHVARLFAQAHAAAAAPAPAPEPEVEVAERRLAEMFPARAIIHRDVALPPPVIVLSAPRAGSTLLRVMLAGHPGLFAPPELHLLSHDDMAAWDRALAPQMMTLGLGQALEGAGHEATTAVDLVGAWVREAATVSEVYAHLQARVRGRRLVDKSPSYALDPAALARAEALFDGPRYVVLDRHPYAVIESFVRLRMGRLFGADDLDPHLLAEQIWRRAYEAIEGLVASVEPGRVHRLRFEDLVATPEAAMRDICAFLDLPFDSATLSPYGGGARMVPPADGAVAFIGDPNFGRHEGIEPGLADAWKDVALPYRLTEATRALADRLGYDLPAEGPRVAPGPPDAVALARDAALPTDFAVADAADPSAPREILLTGGTGFLGPYLLAELLTQTAARVHCHVRAPSPEAGLARIRGALEAHDLWSDAWTDRLTAVPGDLSQARAGLCAERFDALARRVDAVYHNGAVVDFSRPYETLRGPNVDGTLAMLTLAAAHRGKPFHHVSTKGIFTAEAYPGDGPIAEDAPPHPIAGSALGYQRSKWVAEHMVAAAGACGLRTAVYRPGRIGGQSATGRANPDDFACRFLVGCVQLGAVPDVDLPLEMVPVDHVAAAIVRLSLRPDAAGHAYHLMHTEPVDIRAVAGVLARRGWALELRSYDDWRAALRRDPKNALAPLTGLFTDDIPARVDERRFEIRNVEASLGDWRPPPVTEQLGRLLDDLRRTGHLPPPGEPTR